MNYTTTAVIVCAGSAKRMQGIDKIFARVNGLPLIAHTLRACELSATVTDIIIVTKPENINRIMSTVTDCNITKFKTVTAGGATRSESVLSGVSLSDSDFVSIMDGARPLITADEIDRTNKAAFEQGAAALGTSMTDTVKRVNGNADILSTVDRNTLVRIQTPQTFRREEYVPLAKRALQTDIQFTDDCSIYEYFQKPVKVVYGSALNMKITYKEDLDMCEKLMQNVTSVRVGHGYDVHRLVKDRDLILCGEKIDFELGLLGHSDADVATHALMDAMLGAAALGDIGKLFPDSSAEFKDISSMILLERVVDKLEQGFVFGNCDITIIAQKPKLASHIEKMRENIARILKTDISNVNIKATTEEKLGFTGSLEGISAHAVCTLFKKG